jgi:hypothetical protein
VQLLYLDRAGKIENVFLLSIINRNQQKQNTINKNLFSRSGKSTLLKQLFKEYPTAFAFSISRKYIYFTIISINYFFLLDTSRTPRPGEENGRGM